MNNDIGEFDILVFISAYQKRPCVVLCFVYFIFIKASSGVKRENINI